MTPTSTHPLVLRLLLWLLLLPFWIGLFTVKVAVFLALNLAIGFVFGLLLGWTGLEPPGIDWPFSRDANPA